jgi:hypothetical protein
MLLLSKYEEFLLTSQELFTAIFEIKGKLYGDVPIIEKVLLSDAENIKLTNSVSLVNSWQEQKIQLIFHGTLYRSSIIGIRLLVKPKILYVIKDLRTLTTLLTRW